jgi:hypothetical protein
VTADRCRWHEDPGGRCGDPVAFPASEEAPPFCTGHLLRLEPWIRSRVAAQGGHAESWIAWAKRRADAETENLKALGVIRGLRDGIPVRPAAPERR